MMDNNLEDIEILGEHIKKYDLSFKLIVIGDSGVGKSCLTAKATKDIYLSANLPTVGFDFFAFNVKIDEKIIKLQIWDTCGQESYRALVTNFFRNSSLALIVYSIDKRESFENIPKWIKELKMHSCPDCKIFLIGSKNDLEDKREITFEEGQKMKNSQGLDLFMECSSKTGFNAQKIFLLSAQILYNDYMKYTNNNHKDIEGNHRVMGAIKGDVDLNKVINNNESEGCC